MNMNETGIKIFKRTAFVITALNLFVLVIYIIPNKLAKFCNLSMREFDKYAAMYFILFALTWLTFKCIGCFYNVLVKESLDKKEREEF